MPSPSSPNSPTFRTTGKNTCHESEEDIRITPINALDNVDMAKEEVLIVRWKSRDHDKSKSDIGSQAMFGIGVVGRCGGVPDGWMCPTPGMLLSQRP